MKIKGIELGKAIPVAGHGGQQGCEILRILQFVDNQLTDGSDVVRQPAGLYAQHSTHFC
jgi:hypothetical protein